MSSTRNLTPASASMVRLRMVLTSTPSFCTEAASFWLSLASTSTAPMSLLTSAVRGDRSTEPVVATAGVAGFADAVAAAAVGVAGVAGFTAAAVAGLAVATAAVAGFAAVAVAGFAAAAVAVAGFAAAAVAVAGFATAAAAGLAVATVAVAGLTAVAGLATVGSAAGAPAGFFTGVIRISSVSGSSMATSSNESGTRFSRAALPNSRKNVALSGVNTPSRMGSSRDTAPICAAEPFFRSSRIAFFRSPVLTVKISYTVMRPAQLHIARNSVSVKTPSDFMVSFTLGPPAHLP